MMTVPTTSDDTPSFEHVTVLAKEVLRALAPERGGLYLDVTAGGGGHAAAILMSAQNARVIAFDRDLVAGAAARKRLAPFGERALVVHCAFSGVADWLVSAEMGQVQGLIADLGVSSHQLADRERGMSFRSEGPLDMRMDTTEGETARELIERVSQEELADIIYQLGEERRSRRVAAG